MEHPWCKNRASEEGKVTVRQKWSQKGREAGIAGGGTNLGQQLKNMEKAVGVMGQEPQKALFTD